ncbi:hypothetical protein BC833DRAFT_611572 [Globomyces pollinis-pini]|nr:hypothetical protein BC833DRAFT_611572 [Globomyces pollinis-pini]
MLGKDHHQTESCIDSTEGLLSTEPGVSKETESKTPPNENGEQPKLEVGEDDTVVHPLTNVGELMLERQEKKSELGKVDHDGLVEISSHDFHEKRSTLESKIAGLVEHSLSHRVKLPCEYEKFDTNIPNGNKWTVDPVGVLEYEVTLTGVGELHNSFKFYAKSSTINAALIARLKNEICDLTLRIESLEQKKELSNENISKYLEAMTITDPGDNTALEAHMAFTFDARCPYCRKSLKDKKTLVTHLLLSCGKLLEESNEHCAGRTGTYKCIFCNTKLLESQPLNSHLSDCEVFLVHSRKELENRIKHLRTFEERLQALYKSNLSYKQTLPLFPASPISQMQYLNSLNLDIQDFHPLIGQETIQHQENRSMHDLPNVNNVRHSTSDADYINFIQ